MEGRREGRERKEREMNIGVALTLLPESPGQCSVLLHTWEVVALPFHLCQVHHMGRCWLSVTSLCSGLQWLMARRGRHAQLGMGFLSGYLNAPFSNLLVGMQIWRRGVRGVSRLPQGGKKEGPWASFPGLFSLALPHNPPMEGCPLHGGLP